MSALPFELPASFHAHAARDGRWAYWVAGVPATTAALLGEWELTVDGPPCTVTRRSSCR